MRDARTRKIVDADHFVQIVVDRLDEYAASEVFKPTSAISLNGIEIRSHYLLIYQAVDHIIHPNTITLYHIIHQYRAIIVVAMEHAHIRVDARLDEQSLEFAIKHTIAIVSRALTTSRAGC